MAIHIITDSTSYIDEDTQTSLDIIVVPLNVHFHDESFAENQVAYDYFFNRIINEHIIPSSSRPATGSFYNIFADIAAQGDEILGIFMSAKMSGTYQTALNAKIMVMEKYPEARIEIIDSKTTCMALGLQVMEAAQAVRSGKSMDETISAVQDIKERIHLYYVPASMQYLIKGGRVGGAAAIIGSLLNVCPILYVNNGMTDVYGRYRGNEYAMKQMLGVLDADAKMFGLSHLLVHHIYAMEKGQNLADKLGQEYQRQVSNKPLGPVIGLHVGPGTLAIVYCTEK